MCTRQSKSPALSDRFNSVGHLLGELRALIGGHLDCFNRSQRATVLEVIKSGCQICLGIHWSSTCF